MTQERMSIEDLARFLPDEARFVVALHQHGTWWFEDKPDTSANQWWEHGRWLAGIHVQIALGTLTKIRPKPRWQAGVGETYWFISTVGVPTSGIECGCMRDANLHACGNYWQSEPRAQAYADACKEVAMRMHEEG